MCFALNKSDNCNNINNKIFNTIDNYIENVENITTFGVAPRVGAWIEISLLI